jgi:methylmalonyl-CoA/ethylmalonyl-CoA epimerase
VTVEGTEPGHVPANFLATGVVLHHLGVACKDLSVDSAQLEAMGFVREGGDFEDPRQGIRGRFLVGGGVRFELLEDLPGLGVLAPWLAARTRIYHQAYETFDLEGSLERLLDVGARIARPPLPAVAFGGRSVVFAMLPTMLLIELIEARKSAD